MLRLSVLLDYNTPWEVHLVYPVHVRVVLNMQITLKNFSSKSEVL